MSFVSPMVSLSVNMWTAFIPLYTRGKRGGSSDDVRARPVNLFLAAP